VNNKGRYKMRRKVKYYPKEELQLQEEIAGARMWGVSLDNTQLTYFEVEANCKFDKHTHESEQITMVLEGELFFELEDGAICVKKGEVIAIPSMEKHAVYTKQLSVKAVDAWSPVMEKYDK
jgi:quercetin dioxygenase-like cupin family protein